MKKLNLILQALTIWGPLFLFLPIGRCCVLLRIFDELNDSIHSFPIVHSKRGVARLGNFISHNFRFTNSCFDYLPRVALLLEYRNQSGVEGSPEVCRHQFLCCRVWCVKSLTKEIIEQLWRTSWLWMLEQTERPSSSSPRLRISTYIGN